MRSLSLKSLVHVVAVLAATYTVTACSGDPAANIQPGSGGQSSSGATGGASSNGAAQNAGGNASGGASSSSSTANGGNSNGGSITSNGGSITSNGGSTTSNGGSTTSNGGSTTSKGGSSSGGTSSGGASVTSGAGGKSTGGAGVTSGAGGKATGGAGGSQTGGASSKTGGAGGAGSTATCDSAAPTTLPPAGDFTDKVGSASIEMIAIPGGTFTLGCESGTCDADTSPVENITVSPYHIMKTEAPKALWTAAGLTEGTWYDCMALAAELGKQTGHAYRMMTEAEFEFAAKKYLDKLSGVSATEEWAFNSWETKYSAKPGDVDPLGPTPGAHTQKTRRDKASGDKITGRLIRSIDGIGPKCRLTVSDKTEYPPGYPASCSIKQPVECVEPENSYRDSRWVTGSDAKWTAGSLAIGKFDLQTWDDGTAVMNGKNGQWFTSNNIALVFVPSTGTAVKFPYMFLDCTQGSVISDAGFTTGFVGRFQKATTTSVTKPTISGLKSGAELAAAAGDDFKMVDMENIPDSAKKQDPRLIDTATNCWFQNNINAGGTHNYRKDVDADEFRFAVIDGGQIIMLANGSWFTVNNTLLRITHSKGYTADYLYAVTSDGYFMHDSFMGYERADFRMFQKYDNAGGKFPATCINDSCSKELAKGAAASLYASQGDTGKSTYVPAKCPAAGCN